MYIYIYPVIFIMAYNGLFIYPKQPFGPCFSLQPRVFPFFSEANTDFQGCPTWPLVKGNWYGIPFVWGGFNPQKNIQNEAFHPKVESGREEQKQSETSTL